MLADVRELARARTKHTIDRLVYWSEQGEDAQVSLRATIALHEIAWGRPAQAHEVSSPNGGTMTILVKDAAVFGAGPERPLGDAGG